MLRTLRSLFAALGLLPISTLAAHPLVTDDTGTQGARAVQLELTAEVLRDQPDPGALDVGGTAAATLSLGVSESVDVVLGVPAAWTRSSAGDGIVAEAAGAADASLDVKWRFLEAGGFSAAVKPGVSLPTGDPRRGLGAGSPGYGLALVGSQALGPVSLHLTGGWRRQDHLMPEDRSAHRHETWHASAAVAAAVTGRLQLVANVGTESPGERGATAWPAFALAGAIYSISRALDLDVGVRAALNGAGPDLVALAGAAYRF
ncbi:MAG TPA: transporter [Anaeromyxobacteraceae bacterium]|nr:transporter [Anaeromyxobacteraceae bacterium]